MIVPLQHSFGQKSIVIVWNCKLKYYKRCNYISPSIIIVEKVNFLWAKQTLWKHFQWNFEKYFKHFWKRYSWCIKIGNKVALKENVLNVLCIYFEWLSCFDNNVSLSYRTGFIPQLFHYLASSFYLFPSHLVVLKNIIHKNLTSYSDSNWRRFFSEPMYV